MFVQAGVVRMPRLKPDDVAAAIASGKDQKVADGNSLYLFVRGGRASWVYHFRDGASLRTMSLGSAPQMSPAAARRAREAAAVQRRAGRIERRGIANRIPHAESA